MGAGIMTRTPLARLDERSPRVWALVMALADLFRRRGLELPGKPREAKVPWVKEAE